MNRYIRAAIGLVAVIFVVMFIHNLLTPRLAEGAYGAGLDGGLVTTLIDVLAAIGTWVTVMGLTATRFTGSIMERIVDDGERPEPSETPEPTVAPAASREAEVADVTDEYEAWTPEEELAGRLCTGALKRGDAADYLRAFRLLHPAKDSELAGAIPVVPPGEPVVVPEPVPAPKARTTRKK